MSVCLVYSIGSSSNFELFFRGTRLCFSSTQSDATRVLQSFFFFVILVEIDVIMCVGFRN